MTANEFREKELWNDGYATGYASGRTEVLEFFSGLRLDAEELLGFLRDAQVDTEYGIGGFDLSDFLKLLHQYMDSHPESITEANEEQLKRIAQLVDGVGI